MHFPKEAGLLQGVLWLIAIISVALIFWSLEGLLPRKKRVLLEDDYGHRRPHYMRRRRSIHPGPFAGALALLLIGGVLLWFAAAVQVYLGLTRTILVAHVRATPVKNSGNIPVTSVELILYDDNGNKVSDNVYIINGDEVFIGGDIISYHSWLNVFGYHSGYKLTKLEGMYSDVNLERTQQHTVEVLNGGDDDFFNNAYHGGWTNFFIKAAYKNGSSVPRNGIGYNICVSQDAIVPQPDNLPC